MIFQHASTAYTCRMPKHYCSKGAVPSGCLVACLPVCPSAHLLNDAGEQAHTIVVLPERRRAVHHSGAAVVGNITVSHHLEGRCGQVREEREEWVVAERRG